MRVKFTKLPTTGDAIKVSLDGVISIGNCAFQDCSKLATINYKG